MITESFFIVPVAYNFTEEDATEAEDKELVVSAGKVTESFETSKNGRFCSICQ